MMVVEDFLDPMLRFCRDVWVGVWVGVWAHGYACVGWIGSKCMDDAWVVYGCVHVDAWVRIWVNAWVDGWVYGWVYGRMNGLMHWCNMCAHSILNAPGPNHHTYRQRHVHKVAALGHAHLGAEDQVSL